jgi:hypothetical protein
VGRRWRVEGALFFGAWFFGGKPSIAATRDANEDSGLTNNKIMTPYQRSPYLRDGPVDVHAAFDDVINSWLNNNLSEAVIPQKEI